MKTLTAATLSLAMFVFSGCTRKDVSAASHASASDSAAESCLSAAKSVLGPSAEVLKCGQLTGGNTLESVAAIRLNPKQFPSTNGGVSVSKLVVLRQGALRWDVELRADKTITNNAGYVGAEFIDDSAQKIGYRVSFSDRRPDDTPGFTIELSYLQPNGNPESPIEVSWNPAIQRFQEYTANEEPVGFRPEIKNPPHNNLEHCGDCKNSG
jgi:hypothetical protein